jgi:NADPH-dependent F420 reductase
MEIGIIGGTGPAGRGRAVRAAQAGHRVLLGSREAERAAEIAAGILEANPGLDGSITGVANEDAALAADLVVLATPWEGAVATAKGLKGQLGGRVVVSMVNALMKEGREMLPLYPPRGSMAGQIAAALPDSKVAAAFHHLPAKDMEDLDSGLEADVLVCGDNEAAIETTLRFTNSIAALRGIHAGSLAQASPIEAFTAVCITINIRHKAHSTVRLAGI